MKKLLIIALFFSINSLFSQTVIINEIMSSNNSTIYDEDGDASDWIELYNTGSDEVNLAGYYLSDDSLDLKKWKFGNISINPGEYLLIFASDKDTLDNYFHTNFKISAEGEKIILSDADSAAIDQVYVPASLTDISYGRINDGLSSWIFQQPSPGSANTGEEIAGYADSVSVSLPGGFYPSSVSVELSAGGGSIYYTLDGSDPDSNSTEYSSPININETVALKAISYKSNSIASPVIYHTYFINVNTDLPVVSIITDPYNLFDNDYGIYENYEEEWERPGHVQFFDNNKDLGFSKNCGLEIYGGYTRRFAQKSFSVKFKSDYNASALEYPLFPGFRVTTFKSFILRNSGNDFDYTHIRDAMMQTLIKDLDIDYLEYRPASAYINGDYWGIYNIREKISEHYIANRHGVDPNSIDMLEHNMDVIHGDSLHYAEFIDYISDNDMTTDEAYNYINSKIDLDNCLLYFASHVYYNSQDWPANNLKYWRERSENGKWRWILFDLDFGFNLYETTGQSEDHVYYIFSGVETRPGSNPPWSTLVPRKLVENPKIKNKFVNLVADLLNTNFKSELVVSTINEMADHIINEGVKHRERWNINQFTFDNHIERMKEFAQERPGYLRDFMRDFFNSGDDGTITVNSSEGGNIKINSLELDEDDFPWSGIYFNDNPVTIKAVPGYGYKFDGWTGAVSSEDDSINLSVTGSTELYASFSVDSSVINNVVINEINYNSADDFDSGDWIELYNNSDDPADLSFWYFSDNDTSHKFFIPEGTIIEPEGYLVLVENEDAFTSHFPDVTNYIGETGFGLSGSGELISIINAEGDIIDSLTYDDNSPWPAEPDGDGATLELLDPESDNSKGENWKASTGNGTPGRLNSVLTSVEEKNNNIPDEFSLFQNYPNPFNPVTNIRYSVPENGVISLKVFNILGEEIATLFNGFQQTGNYNIRFDGSNLTSGIYFYRLEAGGFVDTKKFILLK